MKGSVALLTHVLHVVVIASLIASLAPAPVGAMQAHRPSPPPAIAPVSPDEPEAPALDDSSSSPESVPTTSVPPSPVTPSPIVGPSGGLVASADGRVFLSFPAGAVDRTVTATPFSRDAATPEQLFYLARA